MAYTDDAIKSEHISGEQKEEILARYSPEGVEDLTPASLMKYLYQDYPLIRNILFFDNDIDTALELLDSIQQAEISMLIMPEHAICPLLIGEFLIESGAMQKRSILDRINEERERVTPDDNLGRMRAAVNLVFRNQNFSQNERTYEDIIPSVRKIVGYAKSWIEEGYIEIAYNLAEHLDDINKIEAPGVRNEMQECIYELFEPLIMQDPSNRHEKIKLRNTAMQCLSHYDIRSRSPRGIEIKKRCFVILKDYLQEIGLKAQQLLWGVDENADKEQIRIFNKQITNIKDISNFNRKSDQNPFGRNLIGELYRQYGMTDFTGIRSIYGLLDSKDVLYRQYRDEFRALGIVDYNHFLRVHINTGKAEEFKDRLTVSLFVLKEIRKLCPQNSTEVIKTLVEHFGIHAFYRYSPKRLVRQFARMNDSSFKKGLVIMPQYDHNGAWSVSNLPYYYAEFEQACDEFDNLNNGYEPVIYEVADMEDFHYALQDSYRSFGKKYHFALLNGHGSQYEMEFGNEALGDTDFDLSIENAGIFENRFIDDAPIILISCLTGENSGLAQHISRFGLHVYAPNIEAIISRAIIVPYLFKDKLNFHLLFARHKENQRLQKEDLEQVSEYRNGEEVTSGIPISKKEVI